jgi:hypothetical protein
VGSEKSTKGTDSSAERNLPGEIPRVTVKGDTFLAHNHWQQPVLLTNLWNGENVKHITFMVGRFHLERTWLCMRARRKLRNAEEDK